ncbi:uncharacterized protein NEMAJ01_0103 [Nematocida major]|uniref:uncharacterized protein n=1 Tax=Nematocida major TaxID=1912982 RepID=UPI0020085249|nr:uncharacterized protein NEMAJ01_0103 [Nematocida major]KAH9385207.1 hypothetical protein NEMAJ01_0103 [Nematocida major]
MEYFVILTNKGPAVFQKTSPTHGRVLFSGREYAVPIDDSDLAKNEGKGDSQIQAIVWSSIQVIQTQMFGKFLIKKRKPVQVVKRDEKPGSSRLTSKTKTSVMGILLGAGLAKMFKSPFGKAKASDSGEYVEGEFSTFRDALKKEKPLEPLIVFEVGDKGELFQCKFKIALSEDGSTQFVSAQDCSKKSTEYSPAANLLLKGAQKNFYVGEFGFIQGLAKSKTCIKEVGNWLYNTDHTEIFSNLQNIIEMLIGAFVNTVVRSLSSEYQVPSIDEYITADTKDYAGLIYKPPTKTAAMEKVLEKLQEISDKNLVNVAMATASLSMLSYFDELTHVIYSNEFIKYIASVEENISRYKKRYTSELMAAERKFNCNLCFLFVDVYHRLIKYRLYITEAMKTLEKGPERDTHSLSARPGELPDSEEPESASGAALFPKEMGALSEHCTRLSELLKATERFKKIKSLTTSGIVFPDCIDDFIETFELTNGLVIITRDNVVIVNGAHVTSIISKKEMFACIPSSQDTEYPTVYIDIAVSSLYPPAANFVTDVVEQVRVHWIRLNFKWDGNQSRFIDACQCRSVSTIAGLEMRLRSNTVPVGRTLRDRMLKCNAKNSHRRMLAIRAQRDLAPTADLYTYGQKKRMGEAVLFGIKAWIDSALQEYSNSLSSVTAHKAAAFDKLLLREVNNVIKYHKTHASISGHDEKNEFSCVLSDAYSLGPGILVFVEYLSYVYRMLSPADVRAYSNSAMSALSTVHEMRNPEVGNDEFLELAIGCSKSMAVPESLDRNEFLLSLLVVRFFTIAAPDIGMHRYLAICAPLFIFNSRDLIALPKCTGR